MKRRLVAYFLSGAMICASCGAAEAQGRAPVSGQVQGLSQQGYGRIQFNWAENVQITPEANGRTLTIRFSEPGKVDVFPLLQGLRQYVSSASVASDNRFLRVQLKDQYRLRPFSNGRINGVDLLPAGTAQATPPQTEEPRQAAREPERASGIRLNGRAVGERQAAPPTPAAPAPEPVAKPAAPPAPKPAPAPVAAAPVPQPAPTPKQEAPKPPPVAEAPKPAPVPAPAPAAAPLSTTPTQVTEVTSEPLPPPSAKAATLKGAKLTPELAVEKSAMTLSFNWPQPVGAAVYTENGRSWIVFAGQAIVQTQDINPKLPSGYTRLVQRPTEDYTLLTLENPSNIRPNVTLEGSRWSLRFESGKQPLIRPIGLEIGETGQRILPVKRFDDPITHTDPRTGDRLAFVPVQLPGFGVTQPRRFMDAEIPVTQQGVVIKLLMDDVDLQPRHNGIQIYSPYTPHVSPEAQQTRNLMQNDFLETGTFFPAHRWRAQLEKEPEKPVKDGEKKAPKKIRNPFVDTEEKLLASLTKARPEEVPAYRLQLAKLYMAEDLYPEALAMLDWLHQSSPQLTRQHQLDALRGMAEFMRNDYPAALKAFNSPDLVKGPELTYWQMLTRMAMNDWDAKVNLTSRQADLMDNYPARMQQKIAFLLADRLIEERNTHRAMSMLQRLNANGTMAGMEDKAQLVLGRMAERSGQVSKAISLWKPLIEKYEDPYLRSHALFHTAQTNYLNKLAKPDEVAPMLESTRTIWRGDAIEQETLRILGQIYIDNQNYVEGLRTWRDLVTAYGDTDLGQRISQRMVDTFEKLFIGGEADALSPLKALALYYEFSYLTPTDSKGDQMIQKLADRLVNFDLLSRAAAMLKHQVQYRLAGEDRMRVSTRLALIHVLNQKYDEALQTLDATENPDIPPELQRQRQQLRAIALSRRGQYNEALAVIRNDHTAEGQQVRLEVLWHMEDWPQTARYIHELLPAELPETRAVPDAVARLVLQLAIAQQFSEDLDGLKTTRERYESAMRRSPYAQSFEFLTMPDIKANYGNLAEVKQMIGTFDDFVGKLKRNVGDKGLSNVI